MRSTAKKIEEKRLITKKFLKIFFMKIIVSMQNEY